MPSARLWFARVVLVYGVLIFAFLGQLYFLHPQDGLAPFGVTLSGEPHSITFVRTSLGAMFTAQALTALWGLVRPRQLLACLGFIVALNACIVAARLTGFVLDGVSPVQWSELRTEAGSWLAFLAAFLAYPRPATPPS